MKGSLITLYATGGGATTPVSDDGVIMTDTPGALNLPIRARIGDADAEVVSAGLVPGGVTSQQLLADAAVSPSANVIRRARRSRKEASHPEASRRPGGRVRGNSEDSTPGTSCVDWHFQQPGHDPDVIVCGDFNTPSALSGDTGRDGLTLDSLLSADPRFQTGERRFVVTVHEPTSRRPAAS